jgi:hypothetical protein
LGFSIYFSDIYKRLASILTARTFAAFSEAQGSSPTEFSGKLRSFTAVVTMANILESMFSLKGKTAMITGGTRGIGKAMALALAGAGAEIILVQVRY